MEGVECVSSEENSTKLSDLNDDCLLAIFSLLDYNDLATIAKVSSRFFTISREVFPKNQWIDVLAAFEDRHYQQNEAFSVTQKKLEIFGDLIHSTGFSYLMVKEKKMRKRVHELIMKHCSKSLVEFNIIEIDNSLKFTKPFAQLNSLYLYDGSYHHSLNDISTFFPKIEKLSIVGVQGFSNNWGFNAQHIPSLKVFENGYDSSFLHHNYDLGYYLELFQLNIFIASNPQLCELSASLKMHKCDSWFNEFVEKYVTQLIEKETKIFTHSMSIKVDSTRCGDDCNAIDHLIVPYLRVETLELCLKGSTALEFISKCRNVKNLKLYLWYDSNLFDTGYWNKIAEALPMLEHFKVIFKDEEKYIFFELLDDPNRASSDIKYVKGSIFAILPFITQCKQIKKIEFQYIFDYHQMDGDTKTELSRKWIQDVADFEKATKTELVQWKSKYKEMKNFSCVGFYYGLTK